MKKSIRGNSAEKKALTQGSDSQNCGYLIAFIRAAIVRAAGKHDSEVGYVAKSLGLGNRRHASIDWARD